MGHPVNTRTPLTPARTINLQEAATTIHDTSTPITGHIAAVINAAAACDPTGPCRGCPLTAATEALAAYITAGFAGARGPLVGANS